MVNKNQKIFNLQKKEFFSKNKKAIAKTTLILLASVLICSLIYYGIFVFAAHIVTTPAGGTTFSVNQSVSALYNITVNNTDQGYGNVTSLNVTFNSNFTFTSGSNGTEVSASTFTNTSSVLTWTNSSNSLVENSTNKSFWFNLTASYPGTYYINVSAGNYTNGTYTVTNFTVTVNDTVNPISYSGTAPADASYDNDSTIVFDSKCSDNYNASWLQVWGNWTGGWHANQSNSSPTNNSYWNVSIANIPEGYHVWGVYCNDSAGNSNRTTNRTLIEDKTAPMYSIGTNSTNSTRAGELILHNLKWNDSYGFSGYMFSFNNGNGSNYVNYSWTAMTGTSNWTNVTNVTNSTIGAVMSWKIWVNDSANNWNVSDTYNYTTVDSTNPIVTLNTPADYTNTSSTSVVFNCSASDNRNVTNITLYSNYSGTWTSNGTNTTPFNTSYTNFSRTLYAENRSLWNCYACDNLSNCAFASSNYTLVIDASAPTITLGHPTDETTLDSSSVTFEFNATDTFHVRNCSLYIDSELITTDTSINETTEQSFSRTLSDGSYAWKIGCCDYAGNCDNSSARDVSVDTDSGSGSGGSSSNNDDDTSNTDLNKSINGGNLTSIGSIKTVPGLAAGDKIRFIFQGINHTITINSVNETSARITVNSTPVTFILTVNKSKELDLDNNSLNDFQITLVSITNKEAKISLKPISETSTGGNLTNDNTGNVTSSTGKSPFSLKIDNWRIIVIIVVVIALIVMFVIITIYNKKKSEGVSSWKNRKK